MAIGSLFEDGVLSDWKEFAALLRKDPKLARRTLSVCDYHEDVESAALAKVLIRHFYGSDEDMGLS